MAVEFRQTNGDAPAEGGREAGAPHVGISTWERWSDVIIVLLLASSSVLAAWSGYQSALWGGEQATAYSQAGAIRVESVRASSTGYQLMQIDIAVFMNWLNAFQQENTELADFYEDRFSSPLATAFDVWIATTPRTNPDAPSDPFVMPEYQVPEFATADQLEAESSQLFAQGQEANQTGDRYVASTVILAIVLFFAGVAPRIAWMPARMALIVVAVVLFVLGLYQVLTLPIVAGLPVPFISE